MRPSWTCCVVLTVLLAGTAQAQGPAAPATWQDTHRVILRNGCAIDGRLVEDTDTVLVLQWDPSSKVVIDRTQVDRVEKLEFRPADQPPATEKLPPPRVGTEPPSDRVKPAPPGPVKPPVSSRPLPKLSADVKERVNAILSRLPGASDERLEFLKTEMRQCGEEGARHLISRMRTLDDAGLAWASSALGTMPGLRIEGDIVALFSDGSPKVRAVAVTLMSGRQASEYLPEISRLARDFSGTVRAAAIVVLGSVGDESVLDPVANAALDDDPNVRLPAVNAALSVAKRASAETALAERWLEILPRVPADSRAGIAAGFRDLAKGKAEPSFPADGVQEALKALIEDGEAAVRKNAAAALGELGYTAARKSLIERMADERSPEVLCSICDSLSNLGATEAVEPLIEQLRSESEEVRTRAVLALRHLTKQQGLGTAYDTWAAWFRGTRGQ